MQSSIVRELGGSGLFAAGKWAFPARNGTILIWFGANNATEAAEKDHSFERVAQTIAATMKALVKAKKLGKVDVKIFRGHDKDALFDQFDAAQEKSVIQMHYVGHGNGGGLYASYGDPEKLRIRTAAAERLAASTLSIGRLREEALLAEPALMTGLFDLASRKKRALRALHDDAFFHIWGCFAGAAQHSFDPDPYWKLFQGGAKAVTGVAKHIALALGRPVIASRDAGKVHGTGFWYRTDSGVGQSDEKKKIYRPDGVPQWLWPTKGAEWVVYDAAGKELSSEAGGAPPSVFTDLVGGTTKTGRSMDLGSEAHREPLCAECAAKRARTGDRAAS